jgi:hypothetical protein
MKPSHMSQSERNFTKTEISRLITRKPILPRAQHITHNQRVKNEIITVTKYKEITQTFDNK